MHASFGIIFIMVHMENLWHFTIGGIPLVLLIYLYPLCHIVNTEWHALYTTQMTQKAKKYHSGFLRLASCNSYQMQVGSCELYTCYVEYHGTLFCGMQSVNDLLVSLNCFSFFCFCICDSHTVCEGSGQKICLLMNILQ